MTVAEIAQLMVIASRLSGVPMPADGELPFVFFQTDAEVQQAFCEGGKNCIQVYAFTRAKLKEIHISDSLGPYSQQTIVVHELTHWLQYKAGMNQEGLGGGCLNEQLAQATEARYMLEYEHKKDPDAQLSFACRIVLKLVEQRML